MKRALAVALAFLLILPSLGAVQTDDTPDDRQKTLQLAVIVLAATLAAVLDADEGKT